MAFVVFVFVSLGFVFRLSALPLHVTSGLRGDILDIWCESNNIQVACQKAAETDFCIGTYIKNSYYLKIGDKRLGQFDTRQLGSMVKGFICDTEISENQVFSSTTEVMEATTDGTTLGKKNALPEHSTMSPRNGNKTVSSMDTFSSTTEVMEATTDGTTLGKKNALPEHSTMSPRNGNKTVSSMDTFSSTTEDNDISIVAVASKKEVHFPKKKSSSLSGVFGVANEAYAYLAIALLVSFILVSVIVGTVLYIRCRGEKEDNGIHQSDQTQDLTNLADGNEQSTKM